MAEITIPGYIYEISAEDEAELHELFRKFGNARRRAYNMLGKGMWKPDIERILQGETGLNSRYVKDAYHSVKDLPPNVTFGGLKNQRLREKGKISKEEYKARRNSIVISRGDKSKNGNLNLRLTGNGELRINLCNRKWIYPKVFIPRKYLDKYGCLLDGSRPYTVLIRRRDNGRGYDVRIAVDVPTEIKEGSRVMTLDINAGHIDFAVTDKESEELVATGKVNVHETQHARTGKRNNLLHKAVNKIGNLAEHYDADVVVGKLNTGKFRCWNRKATRKVKNIPHFKFVQMLKKLKLRGIKVKQRSEAYTTKVGALVAPLIGLDTHKASAVSFGIKVLNYQVFKKLKKLSNSKLSPGVRSDEGDGSPRSGRTGRSGLTVPCQHRLGLAGDEAYKGGGYPAIPGSWGLLDTIASRLKTSFACHQVKIC